mmetsp:Transcript_1241/g.2811  ORF Transcript_1241/g.2811 Transcript_1241/m.2811 type:complete len:143 (+) Transcript_1241:175-603(+)
MGTNEVTVLRVKSTAVRAATAARRVDERVRRVTGTRAREKSDAPLFSEGHGRAREESAGESRNAKKRIAKQYREIAVRLTLLPPKRVVKLASALGSDFVELVSQAQKLPRQNQARSRMEALIAKELRSCGLSPDQIDEIIKG